MNRVGVLTVLVAIALAAAFPLGANAGIITNFTSRGTFPGNDSLDWGQLGPEFTVVTAPFSATSLGGLTIHVIQPGNASFERRDEGNGWVGIFTIGEHLLANENTGEMDFSQTPIGGFGTAIQGDNGGGYTATSQPSTAQRSSARSPSAATTRSPKTGLHRSRASPTRLRRLTESLSPTIPPTSQSTRCRC